MKERSTQVVVGLCGKLVMIRRGRGHVPSYASFMFSKKFWSGPSGTERTSAPASATENVWIGYVGSGTRHVSPGATSVHAMWLIASLAPIVLIASVSGSSEIP